MRVIRAAEMGMCFGVRDALAAADRLAAPGEVTIHGELVHNEEVLAGLDARGFRMNGEGDRTRLPTTPQVLITAHGVSERERSRLQAAGKELVDTTCPLVRYVHERARELAASGYFVVVIGKPEHVEVAGLVGDLDEFAVVERPGDAARWQRPRLGVVAQTTTQPDRVDAILEAIERANPDAEVRYVDTICGPTRNRQQALEQLLDKIDALVVVGGRKSNNTRALVRRAERAGIPAVHVQGRDDLNPVDLRRYGVVGLTAGTSTLDRTIDDVHQALLEM